MRTVTFKKKLVPAFKKRWLKALRSGRRKQGRGTLCRNYSSGPLYCCLGVALAIEGQLKMCNGTGYDKDDKRYETPGMLRNKFLKQIGMSRAAMNKLISLNDDLNYSFKGIADWVERNL